MFGDSGPRLRLDSDLRPADYAPVFKRFGRLHIPGILAPEDAAGLARAVGGSVAWRRSIRQSDDGTDLDVPLAEYLALDPIERAALEQLHQGTEDRQDLLPRQGEQPPVGQGQQDWPLGEFFWLHPGSDQIE